MEEESYLTGKEGAEMDVFQVASVLVEHVKGRFPDDIALIAYYGSYATGRQTSRSDLDFFFIPSTPRGFEAGRSFLISGISFDFWPIGWERAERMAAFEEPMATILADSKLLHVRSDKELDRFLGLRMMIGEWLSPARRPEMLDKALQELERSYLPLYRLGKGTARNDFASEAWRREVYSVATALLYSLSLANQTYYRRGWGQNMDEVRGLALQPKGLGEAIARLVRERDPAAAAEICDGLVEETRLLLLSERKAMPLSAKREFADCFAGFYEELKGTVNKAVTACERDDAETAFFAVAAIGQELSQHLLCAEEGLWPSRLHSLDGEELARYGLDDPAKRFGELGLGELKEAVEDWDRRIVRLLEERRVPIRRYASVEEFAASLTEAAMETGGDPA